jgi:hypothetical protein
MSQAWTATDLVRIAQAGGSIDTSAKRFTATDGVRVAQALKAKGGTLVLRDTAHFTATDAVRIAQAHPGGVTFAD